MFHPRETVGKWLRVAPGLTVAASSLAFALIAITMLVRVVLPFLLNEQGASVGIWIALAVCAVLATVCFWLARRLLRRTRYPTVVARDIGGGSEPERTPPSMVIVLPSVLIGVYLVLWLLTATWGSWDVDRKFDQEFAFGLRADASRRDIPVTRIYSNLDLAAMWDHPENFPQGVGWWRYRRGVAIAPFVIIEEIGYCTGSMDGWAGHRLVFWYFGKSLRVYFAKYWSI